MQDCSPIFSVYVDTNLYLFSRLTDAFKVIDTIIDTDKLYMDLRSVILHLKMTNDKNFAIGQDMFGRKVFINVKSITEEFVLEEIEDESETNK